MALCCWCPYLAGWLAFKLSCCRQRGEHQQHRRHEAGQLHVYVSAHLWPVSWLGCQLPLNPEPYLMRRTCRYCITKARDWSAVSTPVQLWPPPAVELAGHACRQAWTC